MGEASPVCPGEWPLTFPRTEGGGRSPPHGGGRSGQGVVAGKKRKVRRAAVKAVFFPTRQAACRACPLIRAAGDVRGERDDAARRRASVPGAQAADGQAIVTGIGGDGLRLAPCSHRARPTGTGGGPPGYRRRSPSWKHARFARGSGKPYGAIGERGFPPPAPLTGKAGSLRPRPRRPHGRRSMALDPIKRV